MLDDSELDIVWRKWVTQQLNQSKPLNGRKYTSSRYTNINRNYPPGLTFESWLFDQGGVFIQNSKKRFLKFFTTEQELWFRLAHL